MRAASAHLTTALVGAALGGILGMLVAPGLFWGLLVGGAMSGGAISAARVLFGPDRE